jgi:hypothetical protein
MNSFMTSLSKNVKPHFIANPMDLLETKATFIVDGRVYVDSFEQFADQLFQCPEAGVYRPWDTKPLFTPHEPLFTHRNTHEYFPEIAEPVFNAAGTVMEAQRRGIRKQLLVSQTVGQRIDWRDAVNHQINVYNASGRLLLKGSQPRHNIKLKYNPGPEIFALRFLVDLIELLMLEATCWGDPTQVRIKMAEYVNNGVDFDQMIKHAIEMHASFFQQIVDQVKQDPWAIYKVNNLGSSIMLEKSCDYRHFKCNEMLIEQLKVTDPDSDLMQTFGPGHLKAPQVRYEDLDGLYHDLFNKTGHRVESIPELFELLAQTKNNQHMTSQVLLVFEDYLSDANNKSSLASELVGKLTSRNFINQVLAKQNGLTSSDFSVGAGIYIL